MKNRVSGTGSQFEQLHTQSSQREHDHDNENSKRLKQVDSNPPRVFNDNRSQRGGTNVQLSLYTADMLSLGGALTSAFRMLASLIESSSLVVWYYYGMQSDIHVIYAISFVINVFVTVTY